MAGNRTPRAKPASWRRKTVRATTTKAKNRKDTLRGRRNAGSPLSRTDIERFRRMLLNKRSHLVRDLNGMKAGVLRENHHGGNGDPSSAPVHHADLDSDGYQREFTLGLIENEWTLLREINEALKLIEGGKYGLCQATGKPINKARLMAKPWAKYCIEYARMREKGREVFNRTSPRRRGHDR